MARRVARVLIDSPLPQLDRLFDYAIPGEMTDVAVPGVRVRVPLRTAGRVVSGYLVETAQDDDPERALSPLDGVVSPAPVLPHRLYVLARAVADRAAGSAADVVRLAVPKRMVRVEKQWLAAGTPPAVRVRHPDAASAALRDFPDLSDALASSARLALNAPPHPVRLPSGRTVGGWARLLAAAAATVLHAGRSAVLVAPDHRDQEQLAAAAAELAGAEAVVRTDARQSGPARYAAYLRMLEARPCLVVGSRTAAYAPVHDLGLLAVWDDGDPLLGELHSPGVHARDVALVRREQEEFALVFAGHTRTTDVQRLVQAHWLHEIAPARRVTPRIVLSATREGEPHGSRVPSSAFVAARAALAAGPVLVQVARPGYAPSLVCAQCRTPARCRLCAGPLRAPRPDAVPVCAWCGHAAVGWRCSACDGTRVRMASSGSERTADELGRAFPGVRVILADGTHPVTEVDAAPALVVATRGAEPVADGGYRAVLLLDGDRMLLSEDLRVGESCLRWWSNAAALAAPDAPVHLVAVTGAVARALATWSQPMYAHRELADRAALRLPPAVRVAAVSGVRTDVDAVIAAVREALPELGAEAFIGPSFDGDQARLLVRFPYSAGRVAVAALRAAVVAAALRGRRRTKGRAAPPVTLRVRLDVPEPEL